MTDLTVIVPVYKDPMLLHRCLETMFRYAPYNYRVIVIDSSEDEREQQAVQETVEVVGKGTEVIHTGINKKVMGAFNRGLEEVDTRYVALLHDDSSFIPPSEGFWPLLLDVAKFPGVGITGPSLSDCTGFQHFQRWDIPDRCKVYSTYGACMVFQTGTIRGLGGFDEDISPCDDLDLSIRMRLAGYDLVIQRQAFLYHQRHQTYKHTRPGDSRPALRIMFNELIKRHGVRAVLEPMFHEPQWDIMMLTCPTWADVQRRLSETCEEWVPPISVVKTA